MARRRSSGRSALCGLVLAVMFATAGTATAEASAEPPPRSPGEHLDVVTPRMACAELTMRQVEALPGEIATIGSATVVAATDTVPEYCRVIGLITPQHQFELRLPTTSWTQRFLQTGCGGFCGTPLAPQLFATAGCPRLESGEFALAFGNGGHVGASGTDASWATDRALVEDFAYESEHQLAVVSKNVIQMFYGQQPRYSYFNGCSNGGRQALMLTQRYPEDFDGVSAGAPANITVPLVVFSLGWNARANLAPDGGQILTAEDLPVLHEAALAACDAEDGLTDGLITDPRACAFDPGTLLCQAGQETGCLTAAEVTAARQIYQGAVDEHGRQFYPGDPTGGMPVGSELAWVPWIVRANPAVPSLDEQFAGNYLRYLASLDPSRSYDLQTLSFDRATFRQLSEMTPILESKDPDLRPFRDAGGKLIIWHGWNDAAIPAQGSIAYYEALRRFTGEQTPDFARLYVVPGMYHCAGGEGPSEFNLLGPLMDWVEQGDAPEGVIATQRDAAGAVVRTRPIYPYPRIAVYQGTGDPNDAASFVDRRAGRYPRGRWVGEFSTGYQQWCSLEDGRLVCSTQQRDAA